MAYGQLDKVMRFLWRRVTLDTVAVTDRQLLERFAHQRDEDAFASLVDRHGPMVLAVCRRVLGDVHAADDAFQATFLVLAQKATAVRWQESAGGWLYEVAYRIAQKSRVDAARRRVRERQVPDMSTMNPAADLVLGELRQVLDEELTRLPEKYRAPLVLCYLEGKTNEEAAAQLGWTKGTVSGQLARARELLRARLSRRGVALPAAACGLAIAESAAPAAVPTVLASSTIRAALLGTAARAAATGVVTAPVAALAEEVMRTMFVAKLKMAAIILVAVACIGAGAGLGYRSLARSTQMSTLAPSIPADGGSGEQVLPYSETTMARTRAFKEHISDFWVDVTLYCNGDHRIGMFVTEGKEPAEWLALVRAQLPKERATRLIDSLAKMGFFDCARVITGKDRPREGLGYAMTASNGKQTLHEFINLDFENLQRLDTLAADLDGEPASKLHELLERTRLVEVVGAFRDHANTGKQRLTFLFTFDVKSVVRGTYKKPTIAFERSDLDDAFVQTLGLGKDLKGRPERGKELILIAAPNLRQLFDTGNGVLLSWKPRDAKERQ